MRHLARAPVERRSTSVPALARREDPSPRGRSSRTTRGARDFRHTGSAERIRNRRRESLIALRRDFHRHPELSFEERRTAEIIAERLNATDMEVRTGIGRTGVVGVLHGDRPGRTVAWRADIDALPLAEVLDQPFVSGTPQVMHACGHDGPTAIAITLAEILAARRRDVPGTAVFIFQPAEEIFGGAKPMIEAGVLERPRVDEVYGLHLTTWRGTMRRPRVRARAAP